MSKSVYTITDNVIIKTSVNMPVKIPVLRQLDYLEFYNKMNFPYVNILQFLQDNII